MHYPIKYIIIVGLYILVGLAEKGLVKVGGLLY